MVKEDPDSTVPVAAAVGMHLLDTVIHTWDVASRLGNPYRSDGELLTIVAAPARNGFRQVPPESNPGHRSPQRSPPIRPTHGFEPLALLGRENAS